MTEPDGGLSIGDLARRTGVPAATLRSWEERHGFPRPRRAAGGHRRYDPGDAGLIEAVLGLRASGMTLQAAIGQVTSAAGPEPSVYAALRRRHPGLIPQLLRRSTLLALTRAVEDECCARAARPVLFASFQHERFFRRSQRRWEELARTARVVVVFAEFPEPTGPELTGPELTEPAPAGPEGPPSATVEPIRVPLPADAPARREWTLVCDSPDYPACVSGWEFPGQAASAGSGRRFEVIWSADPQVTREAGKICAQLARSFRPDLGPLLAGLPADPPAPASADLRRAASLLSRMTGYLDRPAGRAGPPAAG